MNYSTLRNISISNRHMVCLLFFFVFVLALSLILPETTSAASRARARTDPAPRGPAFDNAPPNVTIPNVVGMPENDAANTILKAFLGVEIWRNYDACPPDKDGKVLLTMPPAGQQRPKGYLVAIDVCILSYKNVPNVVGMNQVQATKTLEQAGFKVNPQIMRSDPNKKTFNVVKQSPPGGAPATKGSTIILFLQ